MITRLLRWDAGKRVTVHFVNITPETRYRIFRSGCLKLPHFLDEWKRKSLTQISMLLCQQTPACEISRMRVQIENRVYAKFVTP